MNMAVGITRIAWIGGVLVMALMVLKVMVVILVVVVLLLVLVLVEHVGRAHLVV